MKKYIYIAAAVLTATLAACQSEDIDMASTYMNDDKAVHFSASIDAPKSRVNTTGNGDTWEDGDMIKVYNISNAISGKNEAVYQLNNSSWDPSGSKYIVWADGDKTGKNTFAAFYPYTEGTTNTYAYFNLPTDQSSSNSTEDNYIGMADWMVAKTMIAPTSENVDLQFQHQLSKVTVNIKGYNNQYESTKPSITGASLFLAANNTNISEGITATCVKSEVKALMINNENNLHVFTAILLPGKYNSGSKFLSLTTTDGSNLVVNATGILTTEGLESGKAYSFDLIVGKNATSIENITVTPWNNDDWDKKEGNADELYSVNGNTFTTKREGVIYAALVGPYINETTGVLKVTGPLNEDDITNISRAASGYIWHKDFKLDISEAEAPIIGYAFGNSSCKLYIKFPKTATKIASLHGVYEVEELDISECITLPTATANLFWGDDEGRYKTVVLKIRKEQEEIVKTDNEWKKFTEIQIIDE